MTTHRQRLLILLCAVALLLTANGLATAAPAEAAYGAIAVNPSTGAWGGSYNYPTRRRARLAALRRCEGYCRVIVWVRNRCAAVVDTPNRYVAGTGTTRRRALRNARRRAHDRSARRLVWMCSG